MRAVHLFDKSTECFSAFRVKGVYILDFFVIVTVMVNALVCEGSPWDPVQRQVDFHKLQSDSTKEEAKAGGESAECARCIFDKSTECFSAFRAKGVYILDCFEIVTMMGRWRAAAAGIGNGLS